MIQSLRLINVQSISHDKWLISHFLNEINFESRLWIWIYLIFPVCISEAEAAAKCLHLTDGFFVSFCLLFSFNSFPLDLTVAIWCYSDVRLLFRVRINGFTCKEAATNLHWKWKLYGIHFYFAISLELQMGFSSPTNDRMWRSIKCCCNNNKTSYEFVETVIIITKDNQGERYLDFILVFVVFGLQLAQYSCNVDTQVHLSLLLDAASRRISSFSFMTGFLLYVLHWNRYYLRFANCLCRKSNQTNTQNYTRKKLPFVCSILLLQFAQCSLCDMAILPLCQLF